MEILNCCENVQQANEWLLEGNGIVDLRQRYSPIYYTVYLDSLVKCRMLINFAEEKTWTKKSVVN